jgi:predicted nucleic acid-binding protein
MAGGYRVVKKADVIIIDSNIFIIDLRYKNDKNFNVNKKFLEIANSKGWGVTTLINLLEIIGILSFNLNERQIVEFYKYFPQKYNINIIPSLSLDSHLPELEIRKLIDSMTKKASLGDALIITTVHTYIPHASHFITWDKGHFEKKLNMKVLTPAEFLKI